MTTYPFVPLNLPEKTYTPTETSFKIDAVGNQFATSMGSYGIPDKRFGIKCWMRKGWTGAWALLCVFPDYHGWLDVQQGQLLFILNKPNYGGSGFVKIPQWVNVKPSAIKSVLDNLKG